MELKRKVVLLGDTAVGKTSLVRRFVFDQFSDRYIQTIGTKVSKKTVEVEYEGEKHSITLVIWDVLGQQGYTNVQRAAFKGSDGALFVCDLTRRDTLYSILHYWLPTLESVAGVPGVLLANKSDLEWEIEKGELEEISRITGMPYLITSAKTGENVENAFVELAKLMLMFKPVRSVEEERREVKSTKDVLDYIMTDFCRAYGNWNDAMAILEANMRAMGMDMRNPTMEQLRMLIEKLYRIELYHLGQDQAQRNEIKRLGVLNRLEENGDS